MFMKRILSVTILTVVCAFQMSAQQRPITPDDYDSWKFIKNSQLSDNGLWVGYEVDPLTGDGMLYIENPNEDIKYSIPRGTRLSFSHTSDVAVFKIVAQHDTIRKLKIAKAKKDKMPKDSMGVYLLEKDTLIKIPNVKSFTFSKEGGDWLVVHKEEEKEEPKKPEEGDQKKKKKKKKEKKCCLFCKKKKKEEPKAAKPKVKYEGTNLVIWNPVLGKEYSYEHVSGYDISKNGALVAFYSARKDSLDSVTVFVFHTADQKLDTIYNAYGKLAKITTDLQGNQAAFVLSTDTARNKVYDLYYWNSNGKASLVVDTNKTGVPEDFSVSEHGNIFFSDNGQRLFFGTGEKPEPYVKDTVPDDEKYHLDIWSYNDAYMMPMQLKELNKEKNRSYTAVYHVADQKVVQLANKTMKEVKLIQDNNGDVAVGMDVDKHAKEMSWEAGSGVDYYLINVKTGDRKLIAEHQTYPGDISPGGKYFVRWDRGARAWMCKDLATMKEINLTGSLKVQFDDEDHDHPMDPFPYMGAFWSEGDQYTYIPDRYDIWKIDPTGKEAPLNLTKIGRTSPMTFRYLKFDRDKHFVKHNEEIYLKAVSEDTKAESIYKVNVNGKDKEPRKIFGGDYSFAQIIRAKDTAVYLMRKMRFDMYPELEYVGPELTDMKKLTNEGRQMDQFIWGTVEQMEWKMPDGEMRKGLLYKPHGFDPATKYPMIVYYYEQYTQRLHQFYSPHPSASVIGFTEYVSNGYLVFVPDIKYEVGHPGKSAVETVVSGTKYLIDKGFVDMDKIGLQGQSWGGYQTAYIITQTDMFAAAMAGAPVSNMTSAYGGIRWSSGMVRQFQYEETQSRIGKTLWEPGGLDLYIENSPLFFVDKIHTPVLIMHNDHDGAVPWYQGIEYFSALRRLNKPAWMLVYNNEQHNLMKTPNRKDLSIRMKQFFDHYLMGKPAPRWMEEGRPAIVKGKEDRYELMGK